MGKDSQVSAGARASTVSFCLSPPLASCRVAAGNEAAANKDLGSALGVHSLFVQLWKDLSSLVYLHGGMSQVSWNDFSPVQQAVFSDLFLVPSLQCFIANSIKLQIMRKEVPNTHLVTLPPHLSQVSDGCVRRRQRYPLLPLLKTDSALMKAVVISSLLPCQAQAPPSMNPWYDLH